MKTLVLVLMTAAAMLASEADWWAALAIVGVSLPFLATTIFEPWLDRTSRLEVDSERKGEA